MGNCTSGEDVQTPGTLATVEQGNAFVDMIHKSMDGTDADTMKTAETLLQKKEAVVARLIEQGWTDKEMTKGSFFEGKNRKFYGQKRTTKPA